MIIIIIPMLQVLQAMDAMGFDGNEQGEIISAVRLSINHHGDDDDDFYDYDPSGD